MTQGFQIICNATAYVKGIPKGIPATEWDTPSCCHVAAAYTWCCYEHNPIPRSR
jgi:hypothetical protein